VRLLLMAIDVFFDFASPYGFIAEALERGTRKRAIGKPHKQMSSAPGDAPLLKYPERREALR
jgi:2-hydroxychromene-2-carboxylate isomerase